MAVFINPYNSPTGRTIIRVNNYNTITKALLSGTYKIEEFKCGLIMQYGMNSTHWE